MKTIIRRVITLALVALVLGGGYFLGSNLGVIESAIQYIGIGGLIVVVFVVVIALLARRLAARP